MAQENDIVLIYIEDNPVTFARIEAIYPDIKKDWYHVKLLILQLPIQTVTWILRNAYINGETFTMGGKKMQLERIVCPDDPEMPDEENEESEEVSGGGAKIISLASRKK